MPANEFEKQVQKQLDQFQLNPSASVWKKVEEQIREKKRRRVVFFFLLPVAIGLIGFSFYQFLNTGKKTGTVEQAVAVKKENSVATGENNIPVQTNEQKVPGDRSTLNDIPGKTNKADVAGEEKITRDPKTSTNVKTDADISIIEPPVAKKDKSAAGKKYTKADRPQKDQPGAFIVATDIPAKQKKPVADDAAPVTVIDPKELTVPQEKPEDKTVISEKDIAVVETNSIKTENAVTTERKQETVAKKKKGEPKIKWGIDLSGGMAFNNKGTLTFARAQAFDMLYNNGSTAGSGNPPAVINPPSDVKPGAAFKLGLVAEWQVSPRSRFSAGLQYAYNSNHIKVGAAMDTTLRLQSNASSFSSTVNVDVIYRGAQQNNYTNSYHFIQLPVWYHWQVNKSSRLPIFLNAGMSVGYLAATNALVYDGALGGIYYKDKEAFNKMHFNLGTGLSFRFKTKNSNEWMIGPELNFDMSRLVKDDSKQYLMFGGINAKLFFPKKKK